MRAGGVFATRLIADDIGTSILPSEEIRDNFRRDTIKVTMGIAPDIELVGGYTLDEENSLLLAAGYSFGSLKVTRAEESRDAGSVAMGHAIVSVQKPVRGFLGRVGAGVLWLHGGDITVMEGMRAVNPILELGVARRWPWSGFDVEAGLAAQATHLTSEAIEARGGQPGLVYRLGLQLGIARRFGR